MHRLLGLTCSVGLRSRAMTATVGICSSVCGGRRLWEVAAVWGRLCIIPGELFQGHRSLSRTKLHRLPGSYGQWSVPAHNLVASMMAIMSTSGVLNHRLVSPPPLTLAAVTAHPTYGTHKVGSYSLQVHGVKRVPMAKVSCLFSRLRLSLDFLSWIVCTPSEYLQSSQPQSSFWVPIPETWTSASSPCSLLQVCKQLLWA